MESTMRTIPMPSSKLSGLALSVLGGVVAASIVSLTLVFLLPGGSGSIDETLPLTGPLGALISNIVPFVWVGLFAGLGAAFWLVAGGRTAPGRAGWAVLGLLGLCVIYPVLSSGGGVGVPVVIVGNVVTILAAGLTAWFCWPVSRLAALFPALVAVWVSLATAGLVALMLGLPF
jgi:tryptophan-rich sensory protein